MNNKYEDTKKYNLNRFTINQHFIPKESIKRFCDENNQVLLTNLNSKNKKTVKVTSSDVNFIVKRLWNQHAEKRTMKNIEDNFQKTVDKIVDNPNYIFNSTDNNSISLMYSLWEARKDSIEHFINNLKENIFVPVNIEGSNISKKEQETLETKNCSYFNDKGEMSSRDYFDIRISYLIAEKMKIYENLSWGVLHSISSDFVMPSNPTYKDEIIFPITPKIALVPTKGYDIVSISDVEYFNKLMIDNSKLFYFKMIS